MSKKTDELARRGEVYTTEVLGSILDVDKIVWHHSTDKKTVEYHLDRFMGIDGIIYTKSGISFTFQAKCREYDVYVKHGDWTLEYMNDPDEGIKGEFFHLAADIYIYGWENLVGDDFVDVYVFYVSPVKRAIALGNLRHTKEKQNEEYGKATFRCYDWAKFNPLWIWYHKESTV